jgi:hypothetical protein
MQTFEIISSANKSLYFNLYQKKNKELKFDSIIFFRYLAVSLKFFSFIYFDGILLFVCFTEILNIWLIIIDLGSNTNK